MGGSRRKPKPRPGELIVWYGSLYRGEAPDLVASWGGEGAGKADGALVLFHLNPYAFEKKPSLTEELERRGYDLGTLEFRIRRKRDVKWRSIVEA